MYVDGGNPAIERPNRDFEICTGEQTLTRQQRLRESPLRRMHIFTIGSARRRRDVLGRKMECRCVCNALQTRNAHLIASSSCSHPETDVGVRFILPVAHLSGHQREISLMQLVTPDARLKGGLELWKVCVATLAGN